MDIELAKTFLSIMSSGTFIEAAKRLNVTQTTITARIKTLESHLNCQLFIRNRSGAKLTREGEVFVNHALKLVQTWEQAKSHLNLPKGKIDTISIGADISLWNPLMVDWMSAFTLNAPELHINNEVTDTEKLVSLLEKDILDIILIHTPCYFSGFTVEQVVEEKLIHVCVPNNSSPDLFIDWGSEFKRNFDATLPQKRQAALTFNLGPLALKFMLKNGGNGYFRTRVVADYLANGALEQVKESPEFSYPIYISYRASKHSTSLNKAIISLKNSLTHNNKWQV
ncbi:LysR family transcriptional regulator [Thalassotalea profundi]|uniref:Transcriptional regulator n=1 Tax=Thalassotalea profundi TaxID=2036687 RepID=A0ABQ3IQT4_9GAMM|nr:LysR family transcriptional regulator [Thalassotalea profundi]GHE91849.1 transcriptional regulator [Thalassotalea profundi]